MFRSARLKLTSWYLLIIMIISSLFSLAIYGNVTHQIEGLIRMQNDRIRNFQFRDQSNFPPGPPDFPPVISAADLQNQETQLALTLVFINVAIFVFAGAAGYFLAGRTLHPIGEMIEEQNQFISSASHELRTPLATLRAEMEGSLLEKRLTDSQARRLINSNLEELNSLQSLSDDLLRLTRVHCLSEKKVRTNISLSEILPPAYKKIATLAEKKSITVDLQIIEARLNGDPNSLVELFVILLDNAIKYSPLNSHISVSSQIIRHQVRISVTDTGIGISAADLPHVFERFYRADKSRSQVEGYGLGLAIAKQVVDSHHGSISVASKFGVGSTFTVDLPL